MSMIRSVALTVFMGTLAVTAASDAKGTSAVSPALAPNRTTPKVASFQAGLAFPAEPGPQDIFRARMFEEPLVPVGGGPSGAENAALADALIGYSKRSGPDDFSSLTGFLSKYPESPWRTALLTDLGLEYYHTAHYSLALEAWNQAWLSGKDAANRQGKAIADRAAGELAYMYARLGRMTELAALLKSVEGRCFIGSATEKIAGAREGLWNMQNRPEVAFRCGPLALKCIQNSVHPQAALADEIIKSASTQKGFSLSQVADLSKKIGLNYQMAFREPGGAFVVPSVVHWKVGHYAAMVRQEGGRYLLQDPTFQNDAWATREALEAETSGYFLIPPGPLPKGWRAVETAEGGTIWGKGTTSFNDAKNTCPNDLKTSGGVCRGMATASVHLMVVSLNLVDEPVGYSPPVGPPVRFIMRYSHRDAFQPGTFDYMNFGPKWTCDWISYITDNPSNLLADVDCYMRGGGTRTFTGFDPGTQTFAFQQYDQTRLQRTGPDSYELLGGDGSKLVFSQPNGAVGTSRKVFLTQVVDPAGNAVTLTYDGSLRLVALTDAIGQVTTITYDNYLVTKVTDPFGRFATFDYVDVKIGDFVCGHDPVTHDPIFCPIFTKELGKITDVIGLTSQFTYNIGDFIKSLITPYGTTTFVQSGSGNTRFLEATYPDGSRERVEYNQTPNLVPTQEPAGSIPVGMATFNAFLYARNTYYWSRTACALGYGDYAKARIYHWLHTEDLSTTAGILESTKEPLEGRVWFNYAGQGSPFLVGANNRPTHVGRVLDDGQTQLYTYACNGFGHLTNSVDPLGRTLSFIYATNGIDLLEVRQTRAGNNELLARAAFNSQHLPLTVTDAAGQTAAFTYNARGQLLTATNPRNETSSYTYDTNGYLIAVDGRLAGTNDVATMTYDARGRIRTTTDVSGYTLTYDYDDLDRPIRVTHPDSTFSQSAYDRLDCVVIQDRAGRQTLLEYDHMRQMTRRTDPLKRVTVFEWCSCGDLKSLTDPMGRPTTWSKDVQGRMINKQYGDGSQVKYLYENTSSRLRQVLDEKQQVTLYLYNRDNALKSIAYDKVAAPTPSVSYTYDPYYRRVISMTDGTGSTVYSYNPITGPPAVGAGQLAAVDGPLPNDTITYGYDELGRRVSTVIDGIGMFSVYDAAGRLTSATNSLGSFSFTYDGSSRRVLSQSFPNGQTAAVIYGDNSHDRMLQQISYTAGATPLSQFSYGRDIPAARITSWSQQAGAQPPSTFTFGYDAVNQLLSATVTNSGALVNTFAYAYDPVGNRLTEHAGASDYTATYNALNQINTTSAPGASRTNEWDGMNRLVAVNAGNQRTEFTYDGQSRMVGIRQLVNGSEVSRRRFVWCGGLICEERDASGANVSKRFYAQGVKLETGPSAGRYYYTRDHLGSIRELNDGGGNVRARYAYDPFGRRTKVSGDVDADFGFAGMFWATEAALALTHFRAYDPELGRWLSRDPLGKAEVRQGPNLYAYVGNGPVNEKDPEGLGNNLGLNSVSVGLTTACAANPEMCEELVEELGTIPTRAPRIQNAVEVVAPCVEELPAGVSIFQQTAASFAPVVNQIAPVVSQNGPGLYTALVPFIETVSTDPTLVSEETETMIENESWALEYWKAFMYHTSDFRMRLPIEDLRDANEYIDGMAGGILTILNAEIF